MFKLRYVAFLFGIGLLLLASGAAAQDAAIIKRARDATAYLEWIRTTDGEVGGSATAFCVNAEGFFVTSGQAIQAAGSGRLRLILDSGEAKPQILAAATVFADPASNLALVKALVPGRFTPLTLGETTGLLETNPVVALGYPFGKMLAGEDGAYPAVTISTGRITSLRKVSGALSTIQVDASLNAGNWGGPLLDSQGKVVGIIEGGVDDVSLNFATPVEKLKALLAKPSTVAATFGPLTVPFDKRSESTEWTVRLLAWNRPVDGFTVELTLPGKDGPRKLTLKNDKGDKYTIRAPLIEPEKGPAQLRLFVKLANESITGEVADRMLTVARRSVKLSEVVEIEGGEMPHVLLRKGETLTGRLEGLNVVSINVDGKTNRAIDLGAARRIELLEPKTPKEFPFSLSVVKGTVTLRSAGNIKLTNLPDPPGVPAASRPAASPASTRNSAPIVTPPQLDADRVTLPLPAPANDVVVAGGGRYIAFYLPSLEQIAILDVNAGRITETLKVSDPNLKIAGGLDALYALAPATKEITRWDLRTMKKDRTIHIDAEGTQQGIGIVIGYASSGPLVVTTTRDLLFYSGETLGRVNIRMREEAPNGARGFASPISSEVWASADGTAVVSSGNASNPVFGQIRLLTIDGQSATASASNINQLVPPVFPSYDGTFLLTGSGLYLFRDPKVPSPEPLREMRLLPAVASNLVVGSRREVFGPGQRDQTRPGAITIYSPNGDQALFTLNGLDELGSQGASAQTRGGFRGDNPVLPTPRGAQRGGGLQSRGRGGQENPPPRGGFQSAGAGAFGFDGPGGAPGNLEKRVFFIPSAELLVTLAYARDAVILRRVRLNDELARSGTDYLFVANLPPRDVERGKTYRYAMDVKSGSGGLTYNLVSGPQGMTVDLDGVVTWNVPASAPARTSVIVSIRSRSGQEIHHTFLMEAR